MNASNNLSSNNAIAEDVISITGGAVELGGHTIWQKRKSRGKSRGIYCDTGTERLRQINLDQNSAGPNPIKRLAMAIPYGFKSARELRMRNSSAAWKRDACLFPTSRRKMAICSGMRRFFPTCWIATWKKA